MVVIPFPVISILRFPMLLLSFPDLLSCFPCFWSSNIFYAAFLLFLMLLFSLPLSTTPCPTFSQYFPRCTSFSCIFLYFCLPSMFPWFLYHFLWFLSCIFPCFCVHVFICFSAFSYVFDPVIFSTLLSCFFSCFCSHFLCLPRHVLHVLNIF